MDTLKLILNASTFKIRIDVYCELVDNVKHTFFHCARWSFIRLAVEEKVGKLTPDKLIDSMLKNEIFWKEISKMAKEILMEKRRERENV